MTEPRPVHDDLATPASSSRTAPGAWLARDLRLALRGARRAPGFAAIVIATLALAIGANAAIFSVVNAVLLRPLPFPHDDRLVAIYSQNPDASIPRFSVSYADYLDWREQTRSIADMALYFPTSYTMAGSDAPERVSGMSVTSNFFDVLGVHAARGRLFGPDDARGEASNAVILSDGFWTRRFGGDPHIVGRTISISGRARTVIGVLPHTFDFVGFDTDAFTVLEPSTYPSIQSHAQHRFGGVGRLAPGVTIDAAERELSTVARRVAAVHPEIGGWSANAFLLRDEVVLGSRQPLLVLLAASALVLLVGCINVANLLVARNATRSREIAIRGALGASRARVAQQMLVESTLHALAGGALGIAVASVGTRVLLRLAPPGAVPRAETVSLDAHVLLFALGLSIVTAILCGVWPALRAGGSQLAGALVAGGRTNTGGSSAARVRRTLVIGEMALALILLLGATLVLRSLRNIVNVDPGFRAGHVVEMRVTLDRERYPDSSQVRFYRSLVESLEQRPGIAAASIANTVPLSGSGIVTPIRLIGEPPPPPDQPIMSAVTAVSPDYFHTLGIALRRGRDVAWTDARPTLVVSEAAARAFWPGQDPLDKRIGFGRDTVGLQVVGVVSDIRSTALTSDPAPTIYLGIQGGQNVLRSASLLVHGTSSTADAVAAARSALHEIDPALVLYNVTTLDDVVQQSIAAPRLNSALLGVFAAIALLLAALGIYGVIAYAVAQRSREMGVRMALGASRGAVFALVLRDGAAVAAAGLVIGIAGSYFATRLIASWLFGVGRNDPVTIAMAAALLTVVALAATIIPARRATRVDPVLAMRGE
ncbi:MAG TPA: ABC transporter permease [Gemmatimonadaceae bacterium]|nr:ABC transporter permease [Gemmatimonadaceae bacterium]